MQCAIILRLLIVIFPFYNQIPVIFQRQVTGFITKEIHIAFFIGVLMCHVFELKTFFNQFIFRHFHHLFSAGENLQQDSSVFQQSIIDISYLIVALAFQLVVVIVTAVIVTKFLV